MDDLWVFDTSDVCDKKSSNIGTSRLLTIVSDLFQVWKHDLSALFIAASIFLENASVASGSSEERPGPGALSLGSEGLCLARCL